MNQLGGRPSLFSDSERYLLLSFAILYSLGLWLLPKLAPSSHVAIGLSNKRAAEQLNAFRFIVFTVLIGSILVPVTLTLLGLLK